MFCWNTSTDHTVSNDPTNISGSNYSPDGILVSGLITIVLLVATLAVACGHTHLARKTLKAPASNVFMFHPLGKANDIWTQHSAIFVCMQGSFAELANAFKSTLDEATTLLRSSSFLAFLAVDDHTTEGITKPKRIMEYEFKLQIGKQLTVVEPWAEDVPHAALIKTGMAGETKTKAATGWAAGIAGVPTVMLAREMDSLEATGIINPPQVGRTCGPDSMLVLICTSPAMLAKAAELAGLQCTNDEHTDLSAEDVSGFVANIQLLASTLVSALMFAVDSPRHVLELQALQLDATMDSDRLSSLRRVIRAVAAYAVRKRVDAGTAKHADAVDAAGEGREWRVPVVDALLDALGMNALLLTEHYDNSDGTVTHSAIGRPDGTEMGALLLRPAGGEHAGYALHFHAVLCGDAIALAKAIAKARRFVDRYDGPQLRKRDKMASDMEKALHKRAESLDDNVRTNALATLQLVNFADLDEKVRWMRGGGKGNGSDPAPNPGLPLVRHSLTPHTNTHTSPS